MLKLELGKRSDFHMHSLLSDGELLPSEIAQRAYKIGYDAIAITDHADQSNLEFVIKGVVSAFDALQKHIDLTLIPGAELTHVPPSEIERMAKKAKKLGAKLVLVHGETPVEPVMKGTNKATVRCSDVDILAHPGFISEEDAEMARDNEIYLELTSRKGHCIVNGYIARVAMRTKVKLIMSSDLHSPAEFLSQENAFQVVLGAGLEKGEALKTIRDNPKEILKRVGC